MAIPVIILSIIGLLSVATILLLVKKQIKNVISWHKKVIRKISIKKRFFFVFILGILFLIYLLIGKDLSFFKYMPFISALIILLLLVRLFVEFISWQILVIDEGLVVSNNLIKWSEIDSIEISKYTMQILTKRRKKVKISKILRHLDQSDMDLIKSLWTAGRP